MDAASRARRPVRRAPRSLDTVEDPGLAHLIDVLAHLERHAERLLERRVLERQQRLRPGDRLAYAGELVELFAAQARHGRAHASGDRLRCPGKARTDDLRLAPRRGIVDPVVEATALERVVEL